MYRKLGQESSRNKYKNYPCVRQSRLKTHARLVEALTDFFLKKILNGHKERNQRLFIENSGNNRGNITIDRGNFTIISASDVDGKKSYVKE